MKLAAPFLCLALAISIGCKRSGSEGAGGHGHPHGSGGHSHAAHGEAEAPTKQITVWGDQYEAFVEHEAPVAGKPIRLITHLTDLATGLPKKSGLVRFVFWQGTTTFQHPQANPARAGLYLPAISFPNGGDWEASVVMPGNPETQVNLGTIRVFENADAATTAAAEFPEPPEGIAFLKEQQWRIRARNEPAQRRTLVRRVSLPASVIAAPGSKALAYPPVTGTLLSNLFNLGDRVAAGQTIGWIEPALGEFTTKVAEARADFLRTKAAFEQAKTSLERTQRLFEQQAKSERELQETRMNFQAAEANHAAASAIQKAYEASGATGESLRVAVRAPIDGFIDRLHAIPGARVTAEDQIASIVNPKVAFVEARVSEIRRAEINPNLASVFIPAAQPTNAARVRLVAVGKEIDPATRSVPVTFEFASLGQDFPLGSVGILQAATAESADTVAIPPSAIVEEDGVPVAFVQVAGETYQKRDVELGVRDGDWIEVKSGVSAGERVATQGAYAILLSTKAGTIPSHGHAH